MSLIADLVIRLSGDTRDLGRELDGMDSRLGRLSGKALVAGAAVTAGAAVGVGAVLKLGVAYEQSLNTFQAVTRATEAQMDSVGAKAKDLGNDLSIPGASAKDAASAMTELAKGGLSVSEAMDAAQGTLRLAAAAQVEGAEAAQIQASALAQFRLKGQDAAHVADVLANAANAATGEITDVANALSYVGPVANSMGISVDNAATAIALLAKNGILSEKAGTGLRGVLASLAKPSDEAAKGLQRLNIEAFDQQGRFKGLEYLTGQLADAKGRLTAQEFQAAAAAAFGREPLSAINALASEGTKGFSAMADAVGRQGGAAEVAAAKSKGLGGAFEGLVSQAEGLSIELYERVAPGLETVVRGLSNNLPGAVALAGSAFSAAGRAGAPLLDLARDAAGALREQFVPAIGAAIDKARGWAPTVEGVAQSLGSRLMPVVRDVAGFVGDLTESAINVVQALEPLADVAVPAAAAAIVVLGAAVAAGAAALDAIGDPLVAITGFLADNQEIVVALAAAYTARLVPGMALAAAFAAGQLVTALAAARTAALATISSLAAAATAAAPFLLIGASVGLVAKQFFDASAGVKETKKALEDLRPDRIYSVDAALKYAEATRTAGKALADQEPAFYKGIGAQVAYGRKVDENVAAINRSTIAYNNARTLVDQLSDAYGLSAQQVEALAAAADIDLGTATYVEASAAVQGFQRNLRTAGTASGALTEAQKVFRSATSSATDKVNALNGALDRLTGRNLSAEASTSAYFASLDRLTQGVAANGRSLDLQTEKGRNNREAFRSAAQAIVDNTKALSEQGVGIDRLGPRFDNQINALRRTAERAGFNKQQVDALVRSYGLVPGSVSTIVGERGTAATKKKVDDLRTSLSRIPAFKTVSVNVVVNGLQTAQGVADKLNDVSRGNLRASRSLTPTSAHVVEASAADLKAAQARALQTETERAALAELNAAAAAATATRTSQSAAAAAGRAEDRAAGPIARTAAAKAALDRLTTSTRAATSAALQHATDLRRAADQAGVAARRMPDLTRAQTAAKNAALAHASSLSAQAREASRAATETGRAGSSAVAAAKARYDAAKRISDAHDNAVRTSAGVATDAAKTAAEAAKALTDAHTAYVDAVYSASVETATAQAKVASAEIDRLVGKAQDMRQAFSGGLLQGTGLADLFGEAGTAQSVDQVIASLEARLVAGQEFAADLGTLTAAGLNDTLVQQLAAAGPTVGQAMADALLTAGPEAIARLNTASSALADLATSAMDPVVQGFYGVGVSAGQQFIAGLASVYPELGDAEAAARAAAFAVRGTATGPGIVPGSAPLPAQPVQIVVVSQLDGREISRATTEFDIENQRAFARVNGLPAPV